MNVDIINFTIRAMCSEVKEREGKVPDWRLLPESELLYEATICIFGSQMVFERAVAIADRLHKMGFLNPSQQRFNRSNYEALVVSALEEPFAVVGNDDTLRRVRPRFKNRLAFLLASTIREVYGNARSIQKLLLSAVDAKEAREILVRHICGFGPKQASLFLRRIGYCANLAVLDVHVLDYLHLARGLLFKPSRLGRLSFYEEIEETFREIADEFGYSLGCVDLATWVTMRVAKREALLWA